MKILAFENFTTAKNYANVSGATILTWKLMLHKIEEHSAVTVLPILYPLKF